MTSAQKQIAGEEAGGRKAYRAVQAPAVGGGLG